MFLLLQACALFTTIDPLVCETPADCIDTFELETPVNLMDTWCSS